MILDGYKQFEFNNLEKFKEYSKIQQSLNTRIAEINSELEALPKMPNSMDDWIENIADIKGNGFGLNEYNKFFKYRKEYIKLLEASDDNLQKMKILAIDDLLGKIDKTLKK